MGNKIQKVEVTYMLTKEQYQRLETCTQKIRKESNNPEWTDQMSLQYAIGTLGFPFLAEICLSLLEKSMENENNNFSGC